MRLWLNRTGDIPLREQLVTQVILGILGQELTPGQRLPSTRELARRFGIHANTASTAYRELESEGWVELRHGSGVYVRATRPAAPLSTELAVDQLIGELAAKGRRLGAGDELVRARLRRWLQAQPPSQWLLIDPDPELRAIVMHEMEQALGFPVTGCAPVECEAAAVRSGAMLVVLPSKAEGVRKLLPPGTELTILKVHPVAPALLEHLERYMPDHAGELIGIASRWSEFQRLAQTMLIAAGMAPESLLVRDATQADWKRGLETTSGVVCDAVTALELPEGAFPLRFTLLDEAGLAEMQQREQAVAAAVPGL